MPKAVEQLQATNCGLDALAKITGLKNISAFTIVHLARDNGMNLSVFKVLDNKDLIRVQRPCIFHQKDHFVFSKNGEPMPGGEYTGFVIGSAPLGRVVGHAEAKFITGGKNFLTGKNKSGEQTGHGFLGDILTVVGTIVTANPLVGAAIYTGYGAMERAQNQDVLGSPWDPKSLALDAVKGFGEGLMAGGAAAGSAAAGTNAGIGAHIQGAIQGGWNALAHPIATAAHGFSGVGSGLASQVGAFGGGASNAFNLAGGAAGAANAASGIGSTISGIGNAASGLAAFGGGVAPYSAPAASFAPSNFTVDPGFNTSNISNFTSPFRAAGSVTSNSGGAGANTAINPVSTASNTAGGTAAGSGLWNKVTSAVGSQFNNNPIGTVGAGVGLLGMATSKAPAFQGPSATDNYSAAKQFLGPNALSAPTQAQLSEYVKTPLADLAKTFTSGSTRVADAINKAYDNQRMSLVQAYGNAGQNMSNSSELQQKVSDLEQKRVNDITNANEEVQNQALGQAVQVKQQALSQAMSSGQFDMNLAMELASLNGSQDALKFAIANNDYAGFQQLMGNLLTMGLNQSVAKK